MSPTDTHSYRWIEDLPASWEGWSDPQLSALIDLWQRQKTQLRDKTLLDRFNEELARQWAIETGILERVYYIDDATSKTLIEEGLKAALIPHGATDRPAEEIIRVLKDHEEALDAIYAYVGKGTPLTLSFIKQLHQVIVRHQDECEAVNSLGQPCTVQLIKGDWKKWPNHLTQGGRMFHEFCPPEHTQAEMENLCRWHGAHDPRKVSAVVEAAWLHHRFTQIHPFQDSNGRMARALASFVLLRGGLFPLVISRTLKAAYIDSLQKADHGSLEPLVTLVARQQSSAVLRALALADEVAQGQAQRPYTAVIQEAAEDLKRRNRRTQKKAAEVVLGRATKLQELAFQILRDVHSDLTGSGIRADPPQQSNQSTEYYFSQQIIQVARHFGYFVLLDRPRFWTRIQLTIPSRVDLVVSLHVRVMSEKPLMVSTAFLTRTVQGPTGEKEFVVEPASVEPFWFTDEEPQNGALLASFDKWLKEAVTIGLEKWRRSL